jgi:type VI secretion system protein ImpA
MPLLDELLTPIAGDNPAGSYLRYDPIYDTIKEARREDLDVPQGDWQTSLKTADWPAVIKLTTEALSKKTKDLQLAAWLMEARLRREGFVGLREGLELLERYILDFWDHLHPELEDGDPELRAAPLEWVGRYMMDSVRRAPLNREGHSWIEYQAARALGSEEEAESDSAKREARERAGEAGNLLLEEFDKAVETTPKAWYKALSDDLSGSIETLKRLEALCDERFGDVSPSFIPLRQGLQELKNLTDQLLARKLAADPDPIGEVVVEGEMDSEGLAEGETGDVGGATGLAIASSARIGGIPISPTPRTRDEADSRVAASARFMRAESQADPAPYLLLRGFRWGELRAGEEAPDPTLLVAPPTDVRTNLKTLLLEERWEELLEAAEEVMGQPYGRGWLDLQRYCVAACDALGGEFAPLGVALRSAIRALLHDLPSLPFHALMDDSPTANAETRQWLVADNLLPRAVEEESRDEPLPVVAQRTNGRRDVLQRARERIAAGAPQEGIQLLMLEASRERSPRGSFLRRLQAAGIMVEAGHERVALPLLREMLEKVETFNLEQWEDAEIIAQLLGLLIKCIRTVQGESSEVQQYFVRLSRLDPLQGITISKTMDFSGGY